MSANNNNNGMKNALWANEIQRLCLIEAGDDVSAGLAAAGYILATQNPDEVDVTLREDSATLSTDKHGHEHGEKGSGHGGQFVHKRKTEAAHKATLDTVEAVHELIELGDKGYYDALGTPARSNIVLKWAEGANKNVDDSMIAAKLHKAAAEHHENFGKMLRHIVKAGLPSHREYDQAEKTINLNKVAIDAHADAALHHRTTYSKEEDVDWRPNEMTGEDFYASVDKTGREHEKKGSSKGGQFTSKNNNSSPSLEEIKKSLPSQEDWAERLRQLWEELPLKLRPSNADTDTYDDYTKTRKMSGMCAFASESLQDYLAKKDISTKLTGGAYDDAIHVWLQAKDGTIIDPTYCQFNKNVPIGAIIVHPTDDRIAVYYTEDPSGRLLEQFGIDRKKGLDFSKVSTDAAFSHDIHNKKAQGILNKSLVATRGLTANAKHDLAVALKKMEQDSGASILNFIDKYRVQLGNLLTNTQLAAVLEGAREIANKIPTLATFPGAIAPPATLEPKRAIALVERLEKLKGDKRATAIYKLPEEQQTYVQQVLAAKEAGTAVSPTTSLFSSGDDKGLHFPTIDEAVRHLSEKNVLTLEQYDALDAAARNKAFTVAGVNAQETLTKIRDSLAENVKEGVDYATFKQKVLDSVDKGTFLSEPFLETIFRNNIQSAFSDGQAKILSHPIVRSGFPYSAYDAIHDDRVRENHLALEKLGINKTNVYRNDDPVFQMFRPPWDWSDRCSWTPMTVRQAAEAGIREARKWLHTGVEPTPPAFVKMPSFRPPEDFQRDVATAPLSIQLSLQSMATFAHDVSGEKRDESGRWTEGGNKLTPVIKESSYDPIEKYDAASLYEAVAKTIGDRSHLSPMAKRADEQKLTKEHKKAYSEALKKAISRMPESAIRRIAKNVTAFRWHADHKGFATVTSNRELRQRIMSGATEVGGMFTAKEGPGEHSEAPNKIAVEIHLDGGHTEEALQRGADKDAGSNLVEAASHTHHVYAHELTHGIDGHEHEISGSKEWKDAFDEEITSGKLSHYATISPSEGFAEFGRMVYASNKSREWIRNNFPKSMKVWEKYKL